MTAPMFGSSGNGALVQPTDGEPGEALPSDEGPRSSPFRPRQLTWRAVAARSGALVLLVALYARFLGALHAVIASPAFLVGLGICLLAAAWLGVRGALVVIACVAVVDRSFAMGLPASMETGPIAGVIALLVKLVLAGGLGVAVDSRRRALVHNQELQREVSARTRSERALQRSEAMQRALVESLGEGVGLFDARGAAVFANQALTETLGAPREELSQRPFTELLTEESRGKLAGVKASAGERRSYEVVLQRDANKLLLVTETCFAPSGSQEELTLRVVRDLTERVVTERRQRELELQLQRAQALQSLAVLAGGVAHDFNNLLCGVVGNADIALRRLPTDAPPALARCLTEIMNFAGEAAQLSKQMLAYAGRRSLAIRALDPSAELSAALQILHTTIESKAQLVLELEDELPPLLADRVQLRQVVTNLLLNALDAMTGTRGTLTLVSQHVRLDAPGAERYGLGVGDYVRITVRDTGTGIVPEARDRLFEPFFSTKGAGRGMGLAAAAGIVRAHRGWLGVDETSPEGTTFGLLLPAALEAAPPRCDHVPVTELASFARGILLIDDEPAVRLVTGRMLSELGHQVATADSGRRGVELLQQQSDTIDLVILDLTMPEQSGEQTLEQLRLVRTDIPVVITSGFQAEDASSLLRRPNVVGFLDKPHTMTSMEMLLASVAKHAPRGMAAPIRVARP
jgi:two-component system, cell cycle sensor histidine kinase and response regulator CckA